MGTPVGALVYNAWLSLFKLAFVVSRHMPAGAETLSIEGAAAALVEGTLPAYFERLVRASSTATPHLTALIERGFTGIEWDFDMHGRLSGEQPCAPPGGGDAVARGMSP